MSEIRTVLAGWIAQANSQVGSISDATDPAEWVADRFLDWWKPLTNDAIEEAEAALVELRKQLYDSSSTGIPVETLEAFETLADAIESIRAAFLHSR